jgi:sugar O-acyltransferase (sialic acid O-acetyltransferase NeuD family)
MRYYLFGTNSIAKMIAGFLRDDTNNLLLGFVLNSEYIHEREFMGYPIAAIEELACGDFGILNCVGYSNQMENRARIGELIRNLGLRTASYIHPNADVMGVEFGEGNIIMPRAVIEQQSKVGNGNLFYGGCYICHDAVIGDYNWFAACCTLAGRINIGNKNFIGINASVREDTNIANSATIGASAVVLRDVPDNAVMVGNPAAIRWYSNNERKERGGG